ncbi:protein phosphatase 1 regulatory subunit 3A-like isoform X3 [Silurus asotus]|uniref:Protein phosphatase 1 regulatory subunit 3A-like isoform X3 n=1 Tax=Silurus asotus TaxID=30991 RepID=A0AAD5A6M3_SILAS|nr:protein phosphatase 1 regulatory subunit 3A-like isoform X3 [Silurus asotus]
MAQGNHFLTIPKQEGLFTTIKSGRAEESRDDFNVEDEDDEENEEDVRFIPRSSPVPRKRGPSIADETAEYMRIRLALPPRRVSFADATGGNLVDVREFAAFDSGDDEDDADWEEEEARCRRAYLQPVYRVWPEFQTRAESELTLAVRAHKVEVEKVTAVQDEPLAFDTLIRVLNVSYHKCVYVRSTMDGWITQSESTAEYVHGSHDNDTDKFSVRLSFAEPYLFNGARIDFVVRYETSGGEFWANNSGRNYSVTLVVSYEEDSGPENKVEYQEIKSIMKPSKYSTDDETDFSLDTDEGNELNIEKRSTVEIPSSVCPLVVEPEIDIEISEAPLSPTKASGESTVAECHHLSADKEDEHPLQDFPENPLQTDHPDKGTELQICTEDSTVSIQNKHPDNDSLMESLNSNQPLFPNQDNFQTDTVSPAPFDLELTLPAIFPSSHNVKEDIAEDLKDYGENQEIQFGERSGEELPDQTSDEVEAENTESSLQELHESARHCSFNELIVASATSGEGDFSHTAGLYISDVDPLSESPEMMKPDAMVRKEVVTEYQQQVKKKELNEVPAVLSVNVDTSSGSESAALIEESPTRTSLLSLTASSHSFPTIVKKAPPKVEDGESAMTQKEPFSNEEFELYYDDPASFLKQEELEMQPALPCKTLEAPKSEVDVIGTLVPSFAFLSAAVCFIVGFHEPSMFLIMALFLVSLCF